MTAAVTCSAGYGAGGAGRVFAEVVERERAAGTLGRYLAPAVRPGDDCGEVLAVPGAALLLRTPLRFSPAWRNHLDGDLFDRAAARRLAAGPPPERVVGFGGKALRTFRRGRALGARRLELVALNTHVRHVAARHAVAQAAHPIEPLWLNAAQRRKTEAEVALADVVHVLSGLAWDTFVAAGVPAAKLRRLPVSVDPRFTPGPDGPPDDGVFRVVSTGRLTLDKGVPVLVEAFGRLARADARLTLVGGWETRGMRRYLRAATARDPRITVGPGDPLPHLHAADLYVQASHEDGFCYAAAEALACGVPVAVTDQTGMKEFVAEGETGWVLPAGDVDALAARIAAVAARQPEAAG